MCQRDAANSLWNQHSTYLGNPAVPNSWRLAKLMKFKAPVQKQCVSEKKRRFNLWLCHSRVFGGVGSGNSKAWATRAGSNRTALHFCPPRLPGSQLTTSNEPLPACARLWPLSERLAVFAFQQVGCRICGTIGTLFRQRPPRPRNQTVAN